MNNNNDEGNVVMAKIISGSALFLVSTLCGVIPFKLAKIFKWTEPIDHHNPNSKNKSTMTVNILLCFGGGVLLATTFLHLLPEINHTIVWLKDEGLIPELNVNLGELLMMIGFFLIYLIEELVHNYLHRHQHKLAKAAEANKKDIGGAFIRGVSARNSAIMKGFPIIEKSSSDLVPADRTETHKDHEAGHGHSHMVPLPHSEGEDNLVSTLRGLLIVLALSIHELFEGFAVGLETTSARVYFMFAAVSAHKFVIAFCIGVELMVQRTKPWLAFVYVVIYSLVSAIGIGVGTLLTSGENSDNLQVLNVVLQGLATGTLLYVIFFEVLSKDRSGLIPYLAICVGFALMFGLQYIAGITENQGSENDGKALHHYHHHH